MNQPFDTAVAARGLRSEQGSLHRRLLAVLLACGALGILSIAALLEPAERGVGTHESLGLPPCGWVIAFDVPCPTCGMTTSFAHAADGNLLAAIVTQPLGAALALVTAMIAVGGIFVTITGARVGGLLGRFATARFGWMVLAFGLLSWLFKFLSHKGVF